ncbi:MAG TPA: cupin-like domain-containing protein [Vicinamibacterales bacterium]|nr:cupin-like domain-containing protein [Vicinamibacterales bacterium]
MTTTTTAAFSTVAVARRHRASAAEFDAIARDAAEPVVLTGCLDAWPLMADLGGARGADAQIGLLDGLVGRRRLHYTSIPAQQHGQLGYRDDGAATNFTFKATKKKIVFSEFARILRRAVADPASGAVYMQSAPLGRFPELEARVPDLPYLNGGPAGYRQLWIGSGGQVVNLHFDPTHNLIAMLAGEKRITLVPPDNMADMYPAPLDCRLGDAIGSRVRLLDFDVERFPCAVRQLAKGRVAELKPGEVLYIPPMWWHHVESFGLNVMINKWVPPVPGTHFGDLTANLIRGILAYAEAPQSLRLRYRAFYSEVLFGEPAPAVAAPIGAESGVPDPAALARANRHMVETARVMHGVPDCLRKVLPQLYDYYVFQVNGAPALSTSDPQRFKRSLARYARAVGAVGSIQRLFSRSA